MNDLRCCACLKEKASFVSVTQPYTNDETILHQLQNLVSEVGWEDSFWICTLCLETLSQAIEFRNLCIRSNSTKIEGCFISTKKDENRKDIEHELESKNYIPFIKIEEPVEEEPEEDEPDEEDLDEEEPTNLSEENTSDFSMKDLSRRKFRCKKCGRSYSNQSYIKKHSKVCDGIVRHSKIHFLNKLKENKCTKCGRCYTTQKILRDHMKVCYGIKEKRNVQIQCYKCKILLDDEEDKYEHVLNAHNIDLRTKNTCLFCYSSFETPEYYKEHLTRGHEGEVPKNPKTARADTCNICFKKFDFTIDFIIHCHNEHQMDKKTIVKREGRFKVCTHCGKKFKAAADLRAHELIHSTKRNFTCENCGKTFKTHNNLACHKLVVHTDPSFWKYSCSFCGKKFPLKGSFEQHSRRHRGEKNFACSFCEKLFVGKPDLAKHMKTHFRMPRFQCDSCGEGFKAKKEVLAHSKSCRAAEKVFSGNEDEEILELKFVESGGNEIVIVELTDDEDV